MYYYLQALDQLHTKNIKVLVTLLFLSKCVKVSGSDFPMFDSTVSPFAIKKMLALRDRPGMDCLW